MGDAHLRLSLVARWGTRLGLPDEMISALLTTSLPDDPTVQRWLYEMGDAENDDPGDVRLHLVCTLVAEAPAALEHPLAAERASAFVTRWVERLVELARQRRDAHVDHLLALGPLIDSLPSQITGMAVEQLWTALGDDDDWRSQRLAQRALTLLPAQLDAARVRLLVEDQREDVCKRGLALAAVLGERAPLDAMLVALRREATMWKAAQALVALGDTAPVDALIDILAHHPNAYMREAIASELNTIGSRVPLDRILPLIRDAHANVLVQWADHLPIADLIDALFRNDYAMGVLLPAVLRRRDEVPREPLRARLHTRLTSFSNLLEGAKERYFATRILHALGEPVTIEPLMEALAHDPYDVSRAEGLRVLGLLGELAPVDVLVRTLEQRQGSMNDHSRAAAAEALGMLGERAPLPPLLAALADPQVRVRRAAATALRAVGTRVPVETWLAHLADDLALEALLALSAYADEQIPLDAVMQAIWRLHRDPMRTGRIGGSEEAVRLFASVLDVWSVRISPDLIAANCDDVPEMRQSAAAVLGELRDAAALDALLVATADADAGVRLAVVEALGARAPVEALRRLADDAQPPVRTAALALLGQLDAQPRAQLLALAQGTNYADRIAALRALGSAAPMELLVANLTDSFQHIELDLLDLLVTIDAAAAYQAVMDVRQRTGLGQLRALGRLGALAPLEIVHAALYGDSPYDSGVEAVEALLDLGQLRDDSDPAVLAQVGEVLAVATDSAGQPNEGGERDFETLIDLTRLVRRLPPLAGMGLLAAFARGSTEDSFKRAPARLPDADDIPRIVRKTLTSRQMWVRDIAALVLLRWRGRLPLHVIADALHDPDDDVRPLAAWLLGYVGDASVIEPLTAALADPATARPAAVALRRLGVRDVALPDQPADLTRRFAAPLEEEDEADILDPVTLDSLLADLGAANADMRASAIAALQQHATVDMEQFTWALGDSSAEVRKAALDLLRTRAPEVLAALAPDAISTLRGAPAGIFASLQRMRIADLLAGMHADVSAFGGVLRDLLSWPGFEVRQHAACALPLLSGTIADAFIERLLELRHDRGSSAVRAAADDALAALMAREGLA